MNEPERPEPEFESWDSYARFARHVRFAGRFVWGDDVRAFLNTVLATIHDRDIDFRKGRHFYRAQLGVDVVDRTDDEGNWIGEDTLGFGASRMKPLIDRAKEGRANPTGIPVVYAGTTVETAISEVRPWVGADVSVAMCRLTRDLRTLDLTIGHGRSSLGGPVIAHLLGERALTPAEKEEAVWIDMDNAFSRPVTASDDQADYAPTQILAELFRSAGYDAIGYRSQFGDDGERRGYNIAIFDPEAVDVVSCAPYEVHSIKIVAVENGAAWYRSE